MLGLVNLFRAMLVRHGPSVRNLPAALRVALPDLCGYWLLGLLAVAQAFAAPVPVVKNQWYRLVAGTNSFTIGHSTDASTCSPISGQMVVSLNSTWVRTRVRFQQDYENSTGTVDSANPATFCFDATWGGIRVVFQQLDGSNNTVGAVSDPLTIWPVTPTDQTGTITMPQELVGFPGLVKSQVLTIPGGTNLTGYQGVSFQINNYTYNQKGSFSINGSSYRYFEDCLWQTTLATTMNSSVKTVVVADGTMMPSGPNSQIMIENDTGRGVEIIDISARSGNTLTVMDRADYPYNGRGGYIFYSARPGYQFPGYAYGTALVAVAHTAGARVANFDLQMRYGGVGGGFHAGMNFSCAVPGLLQVGSNTLKIRLDKTIDDSSGFRVISNHLLGVGGASIESNSFVQEDPTTWTAPSGGNASNGATAFATATLLTPSISGYTTVAHCSDCHARDGRDLQYFAYSNNSLIVRSLFHGLTLQQSKDIAAYIRSNTEVIRGRPWNPPFQPGLGLDDLSVAAWSAGAGLSAVLPQDRDTYKYMMPPYDGTGTITIANAVEAYKNTNNLNPHHVPLALMFPDWNHWLPRIHPLDGFGGSGTELGKWNGANPISGANFPTAYAAVRAAITPGSCSSYASAGSGIWGTLHAGAGLFAAAYEQTVYGLFNGNWSPAHGRKVSSIALVEAVKTWEIQREYQLEGCYQSLFASPATPVTRGWPVYRLTFDNSPNIQGFPIYHDMTGSLWNISDTPWASQNVFHNYISSIWYDLQIQLNVNNKKQTGQVPIDWGYMDGVNAAFPFISHAQGALVDWFAITKYQSLHNNSTAGGYTPPPLFQGGYNVRDVSPIQTFAGWNNLIYQELSNAEIGALLTGWLRSYLDHYESLSSADTYALDASSANSVAHPLSFGNAVNVNNMFFAIPVIEYYTGHVAIIDEAKNWAKALWPGPGNSNRWDDLVDNVTLNPCSRALGTTICPSQNW